MPKESNLEIKVGFFVFAALVALTIFILSISNYSVFEKGKNMKVIFNFANGLRTTAPVRFAGVDSGLIKDIRVYYDRKEERTKVEVGIWVKDEIEVPSDSKVFVNQLGLLGEKYLEILPGKDKENLLKDGDSIIGKDPIAMDELTAQVGDMANEIEQILHSINIGILSEQNQESFSASLQSLSLILGDVKEGKGTVGKLLYDESVFTNLEEMSADLKENPWKLLYRPRRTK